MEVEAKSLGELTGGIEKQIVDNERTLEAVLDIKMAESEESAHFSFVEATSKHLGTEAGEVFANKNGSCQQDNISLEIERIGSLSVPPVFPGCEG